MKKEMQKPEKECPDCGGRIQWKTIHGAFGKPLYNGLCPKCNIVIKGRETPQLAKGRNMAKDLIGVGAMDKRITSQPCDVQIGILRELQHCKTCGGLSWECKCIGCKCISCIDSGKWL